MRSHLVDLLAQPEPRFKPGDMVRVRSAFNTRRQAVWRVMGRDYWHTDREPAYRLRYGSPKYPHIRYAFDSDLEPVGTDTPCG